MLKQSNDFAYAPDFMDIYDDGRYLWGSAMDLNGLFCIDRVTGSCEVVDYFDVYNKFKNFYCAIYGKKGKLYFFPNRDRAITKYDTVKRIFKRIPVEIINDVLVYYHVKADLGKKIVAFPCVCGEVKNLTADNIIVLDVETDHVDYCPMKLTVDNEEQFCVTGCAVTEEGLIYAVSFNHDGIYSFDTDKGEGCWFKIFDSSCAYSKIIRNGNIFWLVKAGDIKIIKWNIIDNSYEEYGDFPKGFDPGEDSVSYPFCEILDLGDKLLAVASFANMSLFINKADGSISKCEAMAQPVAKDAPYDSVDEYRFAWQRENEIIAYSNRFRAFVFFDLDFNLKRRSSCSVPTEALNKNFKMDVDLDVNNRVFYEGTYSLEQLFSIEKSNQSNRPYAAVGDNIYRTILKLPEM